MKPCSNGVGGSFDAEAFDIAAVNRALIALPIAKLPVNGELEPEQAAEPFPPAVAVPQMNCVLNELVRFVMVMSVPGVLAVTNTWLVVPPLLPLPCTAVKPTG